MKTRILFFVFLISYVPCFGQHDEHCVHTPKDTLNHEGHSEGKMHSFFSPNLPMNRDASGTSWQPDDSPMFMHMVMKGKTSFMFNGSLFLRYTSQDIFQKSDRGGNQFNAPNMFMFMLAHKLNEKNLVSVFSMFSLDPLTVGNAGYPLLFQTGEAYQGVPLVDKQHPHDLIAQLALNYTHSFSKNTDINVMVGYPSEPALGPVVFMHRTSAMNNPDAPLGHHWQDATHISFGVGTIGFRFKNIKAEGSLFTGREPNEYRYDFDKAKFDSYSYRVSANPSKTLSMQFSQGFIKSPEELFPDENVVRTTTSLIHTKRFSKNKFISSSFVWGLNSKNFGNDLHSFLLESNFQLRPFTLYSRYEFIQKDAHELQLHEFSEHQTFQINAFTFGLNKFILITDFVYASLGIQATVHLIDANLKTIYGNMPVSGQVYLRFFPPLVKDKLHGSKCESIKGLRM